MPNAAPIEGFCNAQLPADRGFCARRPLKGATRCRQHGGLLQQGRGNPKLTHGQRARPGGFQRVSEEVQRQIDAAMQDPDLLDVRHAVAVTSVVLRNLPVVPGDEQLREMARKQNVRSLVGLEISDPAVLSELTEPTEPQLDLARMEHGERITRILERYGRRQVEALKQIEAGRLLRDTLVPMFNEMGLELSKLINRYVAEEHREHMREAFRVSCTQIMVRMMDVKGA